MFEDKTGNVFTVTVAVAGMEFLHPVRVLVPATEKLPEVSGMKGCPFESVPEAVDHVYVFAPEAFSDRLFPEHTLMLLLSTVTVGSGFTAIDCVALLAHPVSVLLPVTL